MGAVDYFASALCAWNAQKAAMTHQRSIEMDAMYSLPIVKVPIPGEGVPPSKCPGCGSHEYRNHHGKQVCSYCRIEAHYDQD